jgi:catechol 2,3-dioxygenase-like lactoylglutathione lyase family enzyme
MSARVTAITHVRTVTVPVANQERSLAFYRDVLGFETTLDTSFGNGQRWIEVSPPGGGATIALPPRGALEPGVDTGIRLATADAEGDYAVLKAKAVNVDPEVLRLPGVPPMFGLHDPDGNRLYIVEQS